ncbi:DUF7345 domain-containing protein [Natronoarchaeum mannanilyticum]|uniref:DUF7345 domain-containing protein n=2 Tax=Natronoarchaeum mannanilyticum TaxID=926360 RepID=A0AAV3T8H2_9EURY
MPSTHRAVALALATALAIGAVAGPAVAQPEQNENDEPSLVVEVQADGDAVVTLTATYDLTSEAERDAFASLRNDESARENATRRYAARLDSVARNASDRVDREMRVPVDEADVSLEERGDVGVVRYSATWENLAAVEGDRLVVTEPFASNYGTDRPFVLVAPDGYELAGATPSVDADGEASATWDAGTSLDGFEATMERSDGDAGAGGPADSLPGFGVGAAVASVAGAAAFALRRRRSA